MIKKGETFYAVEKSVEQAVDFEGNKTSGRVHGPFVCTSIDHAVCRSDGRNFLLHHWQIKKANKKLLQQSVTDVQNVERTL